jgi:hypothetical protein
VRLSEYLRNFAPGDPAFQFEQTSLRIGCAGLLLCYVSFELEQFGRLTLAYDATGPHLSDQSCYSESGCYNGQDTGGNRGDLANPKDAFGGPVHTFSDLVMAKIPGKLKRDEDAQYRTGNYSE